MPLHEYRCTTCGEEFELLVRHDTVPACPACEGSDLVKLLSLPAVKSSATRDMAKRAARERDRAQGKEQLHAQLEYERSHDRHG